MAINNSINTLNVALSLLSGTGDLNIGTDSVAKIISIGNTSGTNSVVLNSGTGVINIGTSVAKTINIGTDVVNIAFNTGTGGFSFPNINVTGTAQTLSSGIYYVANNASLVTFTLTNIPGYIRISGSGAGGWTISQSASNQIFSTTANTTAGITGSLSSTNRYDSVELFRVDNNIWVVTNFFGTLTYV